MDELVQRPPSRGRHGTTRMLFVSVLVALSAAGLATRALLMRDAVEKAPIIPRSDVDISPLRIALSVAEVRAPARTLVSEERSGSRIVRGIAVRVSEPRAASALNAPPTATSSTARVRSTKTSPLLVAVRGTNSARPTPVVRRVVLPPGVHLALREITEGSSGGGTLAAPTALRSLSSAQLTLHLDTLLRWHGATVVAQYRAHARQNSASAAAVVQGASNIDAPPFHAAGEVWLEQRVRAGALRVKVGRLDFNSEFAGTLYGGAFLNAAMSFSPTIAAPPTYPAPSFGILAQFTPRSSSTIGAGLFTEGAAAANAGTFQIAQVSQGWLLRGTKPGRIAAGAWRHSGLSAPADASPDNSDVAFRNGGWYATFEQLLVRAESPQRSGLTRPTVAAFVQLGASDPRVYQTTSHRGAGVALSEYSTHRTADTFGAGVTRVDWLHGHELVVELFYEARMSRHLSVVADQQWIRGADAGVRSARGAVTTIRSVIAF